MTYLYICSKFDSDNESHKNYWGYPMKSAIQDLTEKTDDSPNMSRVTSTLYTEDLAFIDAMSKEFKVSRSSIITRIISFGLKADYFYLKEKNYEALERIIQTTEYELSEIHQSEGPHSSWALDFHGHVELWETQE